MGSPSSVETSVRSLARRRGRGGGQHARRQLALPRIVDRLGQHPRRFLRRVKAHRVLRRDEVQPPLGLALEREHISQLRL